MNKPSCQSTHFKGDMARIQNKLMARFEVIEGKGNKMEEKVALTAVDAVRELNIDLMERKLTSQFNYILLSFSITVIYFLCAGSPRVIFYTWKNSSLIYRKFFYQQLLR